MFHQALDLLDAAGWQIRQQDNQLRVLVAGPGSGFDPAATERAVQTAITAAGGHSPMITVSVVDAIPAGAAGKRPLVVALPNSHDGAAVQPHTVGPP